MTFNMHNRRLVKFMTHPQALTYLDMKQIGTFYVFPYERYRPDTNYELFLPLTSSLFKLTWVKIKTQSKVISNHYVKKDSPQKIYSRTYILHFFLPLSLNFSKWPYVKITIHPPVISNLVWSNNFKCFF